METRFSLQFQRICAGSLVLFLPFSSFPLVARLIGSAMVAPLALLPMLLLLAFWFLPYLLRRGTLPSQSMPLLAFFLAALLSAGVAFFLPFPPFKDATILRSEAEAFATLVIGICFYLVVAVWARGNRRLSFLLRLVNWSGLLVLGWGLVQALTWKISGEFPDWMWNFQGMVSSSLLLYTDRANAFAYEPSWLAHQLNMVYLPFWLAATVKGFTVHKFRFWKMSLENVLLLAGVVVLLLSVSRIGLLAFLCAVAFLVLQWNASLVSWLQRTAFRRLGTGEGQPGNSQRRARIMRGLLLGLSLVALLLIYAGLLGGAAYGLSRYDERMKKVFDFSILKDNSILYFANQLVFAERVVYWQAGWEVFNDYPILGTGPGNAGFLFAEKLSAFSWSLTEIRTLMFQWTALPNIKSLWIRLLAENGVVGFALFTSWLYVLWQCGRFLRRNVTRQPGETSQSADHKLHQVIGLMGAFVLVAFVIEGFSMDTYALPYYWFSFGILTAACEVSRVDAELGDHLGLDRRIASASSTVEVK